MRLRVAPGFFTLYANAPKADVYFSRDFSPTIPIVGGKLARLLQGDEVTLNFCGWYPDDLELARLPPLY